MWRTMFVTIIGLSFILIGCWDLFCATEMASPSLIYYCRAPWYNTTIDGFTYSCRKGLYNLPDICMRLFICFDKVCLVNGWCSRGWNWNFAFAKWCYLLRIGVEICNRSTSKELVKPWFSVTTVIVCSKTVVLMLMEWRELCGFQVNVSGQKWHWIRVYSISYTSPS